jgi:hypothetical protein
MPHLAFDATRVRVDVVDEALVVTLGQTSEGELPYLKLRRVRGGSSIQADYSVEINDQAQVCSGGVERAVLGSDFLSLEFSEAAASLLGGCRACKVRFPPAGPLHPVSMHLGRDAGQFCDLPVAVRMLFDDTTVQLSHALPRPRSGVNNCRLDARERRQLGWHPSLGTGWDSVAHCSKCDHMVFLAEDDADAEALGSLGQCVKLTQGCRGKAIFIGLWVGGPAEHEERAVVLSVSLPDEATGLRERALEGFHLYLNRTRNFLQSLATLRDGREVTLPMMIWHRALPLQRRLEEWHLVVRILEHSHGSASSPARRP